MQVAGAGFTSGFARKENGNWEVFCPKAGQTAPEQVVLRQLAEDAAPGKTWFRANKRLA